MRAFYSRQGIVFTLVGLSAFILVFYFVIAIKSANKNAVWLQTTLESQQEKSRLVYQMGVNLLASAEAEKSAVMADTDEESQAFSDQAQRASEAVDAARKELGRLLESRSTRKEMDLFHAFSDCWLKLQEVDRQILPLAVQNTNLKAMRLSFGPAGDAIKNMETALHHLMDDAATTPNALRIIRLSDEALTAALNIYVLQAPHIAETTDAKMDAIEARMRTLDEAADRTLNQLDELIADRADKALIDDAKASYLTFQKTNTEIIELSRRNSNIRSFEVSLGVKRKVTAQCSEDLSALQEAIHSMEFKATR